MGTPAGNGLVEIFGEKTNERGFFCMKLVGYITEEMDRTGETSFDFWHKRFVEAQEGRCAYKDKCPIYARTKEKYGRKPVQLSINFE